MTALCRMTNERVKMPCSYAGCPLFGDCLVAYNKATLTPKTNADHIRSMTDEELAYLLHGEYFEGFNKGLDREFHEMLPHYKEWLKQPYGGDT